MKISFEIFKRSNQILRKMKFAAKIISALLYGAVIADQVFEPETQEEGLIFGLSLLSVILIVGGVLLLAVLATISICTVVRHKGQP